MTQDFNEKLTTYLTGCQAIITNHYAARGYTMQPETLHMQHGPKFVKVVSTRNEGGQHLLSSGGGRVHSFINKTNGDVLKPASWKAPAKHARGNIFDEKNGLGSMGPYGPAYLRG